LFFAAKPGFSELNPNPAPLKIVHYAAMMGRLKRIAHEGKGIKVVLLGRSGEGRKIPMVIIGSEEARARVLVLCQQHGDEPLSTEAAMDLIARASKDSRFRSSLKNVLLMIIPMVNPDGAERGTRDNGRGADLNRDWLAHTQPETRAVLKAFRRMAPQVVLDEHEWTLDDQYGSNSLEAAAAPDGTTLAIHREAVKVGWETGIPLREIIAAPAYDLRLAHRYFGAEGASAFLLETTPYSETGKRVALYERVTLNIARLAARYAPVKAAPGSLDDFPPLMTPAPSFPKEARQGFPSLLVGLGAMVLFLTSMLAGPKRREHEEKETQPRRRGFQRILLTEVLDVTARLERRRSASLHFMNSKKSNTSLPTRPSSLPSPRARVYERRGSFPAPFRPVASHARREGEAAPSGLRSPRSRTRSLSLAER
jgi:hypothetical protein